MRKIFTILAATAMMLAATQTAQAQTYSARTDFTVTVQEGRAAIQPVDMFLTLEDGSAVLTYWDNAADIQKMYLGHVTEKDGTYIFKDFRVTMPAGDEVVFTCAKVDAETGLLFVAGDAKNSTASALIPFERI